MPMLAPSDRLKSENASLPVPVPYPPEPDPPPDPDVLAVVVLTIRLMPGWKIRALVGVGQVVVLIMLSLNQPLRSDAETAISPCAATVKGWPAVMAASV